jgi:hypothetical protein
MEMNIKYTFLPGDRKIIYIGLTTKGTAALVLVNYRNVKVLQCTELRMQIQFIIPTGIFKCSFKIRLELQCCNFQKSQNCL